MVSDAMAKIVFLSVPVSRGVFPLKKVSFPLFFTVKHVFIKIKLEPKENRRSRSGKEAFQA
jgi:hypothetical protein